MKRNMKIVKNKYLNALLLLMLFSAILHMVILGMMALASKSVHVLNYFNIVNLPYFIPGIPQGALGDGLSFVFVIVLYAIILKLNK